MNVINPKRPITGPWQQGEVPQMPNGGFPTEVWRDEIHGFMVISAVEVAIDKDGIDRGPSYHVSMSKRGKRVTTNEANAILHQFGMDGAEEDNHVPHGFVRNFWRYVADRYVGVECACKAEEPAIVEDKGDFVWRG